jgi:hypothetical protein
MPALLIRRQLTVAGISIRNRLSQRLTGLPTHSLGRRPFHSSTPGNMTEQGRGSQQPHNDLNRFHRLLRTSPRIVAVCGAGLSASSGLPTFRGAGGLWRNHKATQLASPRAFKRDPGLVWLFYAYRRHMSMKAEPNAGHRALAALAKKYADFLCVSQNVDGEFFNQRSIPDGVQSRQVYATRSFLRNAVLSLQQDSKS